MRLPRRLRQPVDTATAQGAPDRAAAGDTEEETTHGDSGGDDGRHRSGVVAAQARAWLHAWVSDPGSAEDIELGDEARGFQFEASVGAFARQRLTLRQSGSELYLLQAAGGQTLGALGSPHRNPAEACAAEGAWQFAVVKKRLGWQAEARDARTGELPAHYSPSGLLGGRIHMPDTTYSLRQPLWSAQWTLGASRRQPIARLESKKGSTSVEIDLLEISDEANASLIVLFVSWLVMLEASVPGGGGGGAGIGG